MCQILYESEEPLDAVVYPGSSPLSYPLHFISVSVDSSVVDDMTEALHPFGVEVNLFLTEKKVILDSCIVYRRLCLGVSRALQSSMRI
jgi:hypothetical protein